MKSAAFEYTRAASIGEACELLARHGDGAKLLAGGQSLVPMMAMRLVRPASLIDINEIAALKFVAAENDAVRIGACTRQAAVERDGALAERVPLLRQALTWVGHVPADGFKLFEQFGVKHRDSFAIDTQINLPWMACRRILGMRVILGGECDNL